MREAGLHHHVPMPMLARPRSVVGHHHHQGPHNRYVLEYLWATVAHDAITALRVATDPGAAHCHASGSVVTVGDVSRKRLLCSKRIWVSRSEHAPTRPSA